MLKEIEKICGDSMLECHMLGQGNYNVKDWSTCFTHGGPGFCL